MAIYHCSVKVISRSSGASAVAAGAYRSGEKILDEKTGLVHDYTKKEGVDHTQIIAPDDAPEWVYDRSTLWNEVEACEKRKDSQLCREIQVALPKELSLEQNKKLVCEFIQDKCVSKGMIADLAIHHAKEKNPHAHILLTTRSIQKDGFGPKNRDWNKKEVLENWRESWQEKVNHHLQKHGHESKIDHRTLEAQGIDRVPQIHLGKKVIEMEKRGIRTDRGADALKINKTNVQIQLLKESKEVIDHEYHRTVKTSENTRETSTRDGAFSPSHGAFSPSHGGSSRSDFEKHSRAPEHQQSSFGSIDKNPNSSDKGVPNGSGSSTRNDSSSRSNIQPDSKTPNDLGNSGTRNIVSWFSDRYDSAVERIKNLASKTNIKDENMNIGTQKPLDRTYLAVQRQLNGMNCKSYEVGIRNREGKMMIRDWSKDEVLKSVSWLKRENARGADIYIRPGGNQNQGLILVDDLNKSQLDNMKSKGFEASVVVETSPYNHQAWVRVSKEPLANDVATLTSKMITQISGGDPNSADWKHFGRLSGFTNQKPEHKTSTGRSPWALCHNSNQKMAIQGEHLVKYAKQCMIEHEAKNESKHRLNQAIEAREASSKYKPIQTYQNQFKALRERYGADMDLSKADYMICKSMAVQGFSKKDLVRALEQASPELPIRKAGHERDYCERTVKAAFKHPQVQEHLKHEQERSREASRGFGR